jgi:hypothetical protein
MERYHLMKAPVCVDTDQHAESTDEPISMGIIPLKKIQPTSNAEIIHQAAQAHAENLYTNH